MEACFANRLESGGIDVPEITKIVISYTLHSGYKGRDPAGVSLYALGSQPESIDRGIPPTPQIIKGPSRSIDGLTPICSTRCFHSLPSM